MTDAEIAVRKYLTFLTDHESLLDRDAIAACRTRVDNATDPIEKLRALSELERVSVVDGDAIKDAFIDVARSWAADNGITPTAYQNFGVPRQVLVDAGLLPANGNGTAVRRNTSRPRNRRRESATVTERERAIHSYLDRTGQRLSALEMSRILDIPVDRVRQSMQNMANEGTLKVVEVRHGRYGRPAKIFASATAPADDTAATESEPTINGTEIAGPQAEHDTQPGEHVGAWG